MDFPIMGEICGGLATVIGFFVFQQKKRSHILLLKLICDILWSLHFLFLQAYSGMAISLVACVREILFYRLGTTNDQKPKPLLFVFLALNTCSVALTWTGGWSVCSLISGWLGTLAYWQTVPNRIKCLCGMVSVSQTVYALGVGSRSALLNEIITMSSIALFFLRILWKKHKSGVIEKGESL